MDELAAIDHLLDAAIGSGAAPGIVAAALMPDGQIVHHAAGVRSAGCPQPMTADTLFWIASCTKAVTAVAALQLVERGLVNLDESVARWLPELAAPQVLRGFTGYGAPVLTPAQTPITLRHLLTHTSGFAYDFCNADLRRYLEQSERTFAEGSLADMPLLFEPGSAWHYGTGPEWAGRLIEVVSNTSLADYMRDHIFAPVGMCDTSYVPDAEQVTRLAGLHARLENGELLSGLSPPDLPAIFRGGGGLYSTARDYLAFAHMIMNGGMCHGAQILAPSSVALLTSNQIDDLPAGDLISLTRATSHDFLPMPGIEKRWSLGFLINIDALSGGRSAGSLAWAGMANCYYWIDPVMKIAGVLFTQVMPFADPEILSTFCEFERLVYRQIVVGASK